MLFRPRNVLFLAVVALTIAAGGVVQGATRSKPLPDSHAFLERVSQELQAGNLSAQDALLYQFHYIFDQQRLPEEFRVEGVSPLRCGTGLVRKYYAMASELDSEAVDLIRGYLAPPANRLIFFSTEGRFKLTYSLTGPDAVPVLDVSPANGIPDFVERAAQYLEQSWTVEVLMFGFSDPVDPEQPLPVNFRAMQNYGYTYVIDEGEGTTGITLHNNYVGFPPNADPDGDVLGALKVTAAHEHKHCSQYQDSAWSEAGWIELDAVWAEDLVFDQTNDYYNYLPGGSPIRHPELPLDGGTSGTGSYEDVVWQHWMSETFGSGIMRDFWNRRAEHSGEDVLTTYAQVLQDADRSWPLAWAEFTAWNYATASRALTGLGYQEAAFYPLGPVLTDVYQYPEVIEGEVAHLAARFIRLQGLDTEQAGALTLSLDSSAGPPPLTLALVIRKTDGTGVVETVSAENFSSESYTVGVPLQDIAAAGVVVGNPATAGEARPFTLTVNTEVDLPWPQLALPVPALVLEMNTGQEVSASIPLENQGEVGSVLHFLGSVWSDDPTDLFLQAPAGDKSIAGSTLQGSPTAYAPGANLALDLTVYNAGQDEEWLTSLTLTFPSGVSLVYASPFVGGSLGDLAWSGPAGNGVTTSWDGTYGPQDYGVIQEGESATATLDLAVDANFSGPLVLSGTLTGDQFGDAPHSVPVSCTLEAQESPIRLLEPVNRFAVAMGAAVQVVWEHQDGLGAVEVMCSRDGGSGWVSLGQVSAQDGGFSWIVDGPPSFDCLLRLDAPPGVPGPTTEAGFTIYPPSPWLACSSAGGLLAQGESGTLNLVGQGSPLAPGTFQAWLVVEHDGTGDPGVVPVTAEVTEQVAPVPAYLGPTALTGVVPNPFNPSTFISFRLAAPGLIQLDVLDLRGRLVRHLIQDRYAAGPHQVRWDGRDDRGQTVAAGVYLTRMQAPGYTATRKMVLAK